AVVLAGAAVAGVVVQRVLVVGHLGGVVAALDGPQHRRGHAAARLGGAAGLVDRPGSDAGAGTGRLVGLVLLEQIQRPAAAVDQDHPQAGAGGRDRRHAGRSIAGRGGAAT